MSYSYSGRPAHEALEAEHARTFNRLTAKLQTVVDAETQAAARVDQAIAAARRPESRSVYERLCGMAADLRARIADPRPGIDLTALAAQLANAERDAEWMRRNSLTEDPTTDLSKPIPEGEPEMRKPDAIHVEGSTRDEINASFNAAVAGLSKGGLPPGRSVMNRLRAESATAMEAIGVAVERPPTPPETAAAPVRAPRQPVDPEGPYGRAKAAQAASTEKQARRPKLEGDALDGFVRELKAGHPDYTPAQVAMVAWWGDTRWSLGMDALAESWERVTGEAPPKRQKATAAA